MKTLSVPLADSKITHDQGKPMMTVFEEQLRQLLKDVLQEVLAEQLQPYQATPTDRGEQSNAQDQLLLTTREAAKQLKISERTLYALTSTGKIPRVQVGSCVRYSPQSIQKWIEQTESTAPAPKKVRLPRPVEDSTSSAEKVPPTVHANKPRLNAPRVVSSKKPKKISIPRVRTATTKSSKQDNKLEERVSPFSVLLAEMGIDRSRLPPVTNGDLQRIAEVDIATMHGWLYLNRPLPEGALSKLKEHFSVFRKHQDAKF